MSTSNSHPCIQACTAILIHAYTTLHIKPLQGSLIRILANTWRKHFQMANFHLYIHRLNWQASLLQSIILRSKKMHTKKRKLRKNYGLQAAETNDHICLFRYIQGLIPTICDIQWSVSKTTRPRVALCSQQWRGRRILSSRPV